MTDAPPDGGPLPRRRLGRSGVEVSALGFGGAPIGNLYRAVPDADARAAVDAAWSAGVRHYDTAPHYGLGLSERRLGAALAGRPRDAFALSTKVGRRLVPLPGPHRAPPGALDEGFAVPPAARREWDFSADGVRRTLDDSLRRLGVAAVDVVLLHDPDDHLEVALREAYPALHALREQGVVRAVGVGMNAAAPLARFVRETEVDVVMVAGRYTLLDTSALGELLPLCARRGVAVLAAAPFNSGLLAGAPGGGGTFDYAPAPPALVDRARRVAAVCRSHGVTLPQAALRFPLGHPAVAGVVAGMRDAAEAREDATLARRPVPAALWGELRAAGLLDPAAPDPPVELDGAGPA